MELVEAADSLYALPREEFTPARDELVKQAKAAGDRTLATAIGKLRRPTVAAWLLNQLARQRPDDLHELSALGERLRTAHQQLDGPALRELSGQRRALLTHLGEATAQVGAEAGMSVSDSVARDLEEMFTAALAEPSAARALTAGRLSSAKALADADAQWPAAAPGARPRPVLVRDPSPGPSDAVEPGGRPHDQPDSAQTHSDQTHSDECEQADAGRLGDATANTPARTARARTTGTRRTSTRGTSTPESSTPESTAEPDRTKPREPSAASRARAELDRVSEALAEAERRHTEADLGYQRAAEAESAAHQAVARCRAELITAEQDEQQARQRARFARRGRDDADRALGQARRRVEVARQRLTTMQD